MVDVRKRVFFVIGNDFANRRRAVDTIVGRLLPQKDPSLNTAVFYPRDLEISNVKSTLFSFSFASRRVVIFKESQALDKKIRSFLYDNFASIIAGNYLIFESDIDYFTLTRDRKFTTDKLFSYLAKKAYVVKLERFEEIISVNRLLSLVRKSKLPEALYVLERVFEKEEKNKDVLGMQILGALTREFSSVPDQQTRRQYFECIWDAERMVKEGRLDSKIALGLLLTKILLR